jgi:hypothetical protein
MTGQRLAGFGSKTTSKQFVCRVRTREFLEYASKGRPGPPAPEDRMCRKGPTRERLLFWQCLDQGTLRLMSVPELLHGRRQVETRA